MDDENRREDSFASNVNEGFKEGTRPKFLGGSSEGGDAPETGNTDKKSAANKNAASELKSNEESAKNDTNKSGDGIAGALQNEKSGGGFYSGGKNSANIAGGKIKLAGRLKKLLPGIFILIVLLLLGLVLLIISIPSIMIGWIDYNLQEALGYDDTVAVLELQSEHVTAEMMHNGKLPKAFADDLARYNIEVGQVTARGEFVKTNVYKADLEKTNEVAATENYQEHQSDGELSIMFDGKIISADDFVLAVESDPHLLIAYTNALDISARFYYSQDVDAVYKNMGISRNAFKNWEDTGDSEVDQAEFERILVGILDNEDITSVSGYDIEYDNGEGEKAELDRERKATCEEMRAIADAAKENGEPYEYPNEEWCNEYRDLSFVTKITGGDANGSVSEVAGKMVGEEPTKKAAELFNTTISATEPQRAARAFIAVEEPIQRARAGDNGPVNESMNTLYTSTEVSYQDVDSGETITKDLAIIETDNFVAAVSSGDYSISEAKNFSRDRFLLSTGQADTDIIKMTSTADTGAIENRNTSSKESNSVLDVKRGEYASSEVLSRGSNNLSIAIGRSNSSLFQSVVGGNRVVEGGSYLSNKINQETLGAMPSDSQTIAAYTNKVNELIARKNNAERVVLSPFDTSSPNTFFGSISRNFATSLISNKAITANSKLISGINSLSTLTSDSLRNLAGNAKAEDSKSNFTTISGDYCLTVNTVGVEGDLYCNSHNTISTKYVSRTKSDWGDMKENEGFKDFTLLGMDRESTAGVKSTDICEKAHKNTGIWEKIKNIFMSIFGLSEFYHSCDGVEDDIATGAKYTLKASGSEEIELYSGYALYDMVYSLLSGEQSTVSAIREEFYAKYPKDNSPAGRLARISGLSKSEAQIAINYASTLNRIAQYDPSTRHAFGAPVIHLEQSILFDNQDIPAQMLGIAFERLKYTDLRNRNYVV